MTTGVVSINGKPQLPTILGQGAPRIPTGGKIRAGIQVLTKESAGNPTAKAIYDRGVAAKLAFEDIAREITKAVPELVRPLIAKNVPWFTVRPGDFPNPAIAQEIIDAYGEDRGDGEKRLYRFPVVFPADLWQYVMPHELVVWGASGRKFWSEYSPDGRTRYCKCFAPVPMDPSGKRAIRTFGGRKKTLRTENDGVCVPENCKEYQDRQCNLSGGFIFFIPGIKSLDAFELHTNSFYAMNNAIQKFENLAFIRGGRLAGFLDNKNTPFFITKKLTDVSRINEEGRAVRSKHWLIDLDAPIDVTALFRGNEDDDDTLLLHAGEAANLLEGSQEVIEGVSMNIGTFHSTANKVPERETLKTAAAKNDTSRKQEPVPFDTSNGQAAAGPSYDDIVTVARGFGVEETKYEEYAAKRWGAGWKINLGGRKRALEELETFRDNPGDLLTKIDAELNIFA